VASPVSLSGESYHRQKQFGAANLDWLWGCYDWLGSQPESGMLSIIVFHVLMLVLGLGIASRAKPPQRVENMLGYSHNTIGNTTPSREQLRMVALIWIASVVVIVDGCIFLLLFIAKRSHSA
jgi:hypothetical protein